MDTIKDLIPILTLIGIVVITIATVAAIVMGIADAMRDKKPIVIVIQVDENGKVIHTRSMGNVEVEVEKVQAWERT